MNSILANHTVLFKGNSVPAFSFDLAFLRFFIIDDLHPPFYDLHREQDGRLLI